MTEPYGKYLRLRVEGASRSPYVSCILTGIPSGIPVSLAKMQSFLARRSPGNTPWSSSRKEPDQPEIISGISGGFTDGSPIRIRIPNTDAEKQDRIDYSVFPRPSHADYAAVQKYGKTADLRGGGHFSGRLTAPLCAAGFVCGQVLSGYHIEIFAHVAAIGSVSDSPVDPLRPDISALYSVRAKTFPTLSDTAGNEMISAILDAKSAKDSLGGIIECIVTGLPAGLGEHLFRSAEAAVSDAVFAIPGVKGIEFGDGFAAASATGSQNNDGYRTDGTRITTETNHAGGILGGMTTGAPLVFRVACKPTPSIGIPQHTVNLDTFENTDLEILGRNDPCFVPRAVPVVEAAAAVALCDLILSDIPSTGTAKEYRRRIDNADAVIADAWDQRMNASEQIGNIKKASGAAVYHAAREQAVLQNYRNRTEEGRASAAESLCREILRLSKEAQRQPSPVLTGFSAKKIRLIGAPLGHSFSVPIHRRIADYSYTLHPLSAEELPAFFENKDFDGLNVTIPYKRTVLPYLDTLSEEAAAIGAVNTVVKNPDGTLSGYNTDTEGFAMMLAQLPDIGRCSRAVILGNGGAAAAVRYVLQKQGIPFESVTRTGDGCLHYDSLTDDLFEKTLLINCTPCGMFPEEGPALLTDSMVARCSAVLDLVYNPRRTRLIQQAQKADIPCTDGLSMLVYQAAAAAGLFCGSEISDNTVRLILKELTQETANIVLIGMPGSGKSTVGTLLARMTGRRFFDTDKDIEERTGYTAADYIRAFGEAAFRTEEEISVKTAAHLRGAVISTGGGSVLSSENRYRLRSTGRVFLLNRPLSALATENRPLSARNRMKELYEERLPFYRETADTVVCDMSAADTAAQIYELFYS